MQRRRVQISTAEPTVFLVERLHISDIFPYISRIPFRRSSLEEEDDSEEPEELLFSLEL